MNLRVQNMVGGGTEALLNSATQKAVLREQLRIQRAQLSAEFCELASKHITQRLSSCDFIQTAQELALYWPAFNECNPLALLAHLTFKQAYLPVINSQLLLDFYPYHPGENLLPNKFNIPEPSTENKHPIDLQNLEVVLMPLLGFDEKGKRLGMGGGYYDRSFAFLKNNPTKRPLLIGLAYEFQKLDQLPTDSWDVDLDYVVTEAGLYKPAG